MSSDFHTKGVTGAPFIKHREMLMGIEPESEYSLYDKYQKAQLENEE